MIPKTIHYCWFGNKALPPLAKKCLKSWQKYCPDYEIKKWDENNFDVHICRYVQEAYAAKKYAFVADFVRLWVLVNFGGIYMDTDVEVIKPLDPILPYKAISGFEDNRSIPTGLMACEPGFALFAEFLHEYKDLAFILPDGTPNLTTNVTRITQRCVQYGLQCNNTLQTIEGFTLFPHEYFCPKNAETREIIITPNTYTIHHFMGSWCSHTDLQRRIYLYMTRFLGVKPALLIRNQWRSIKSFLTNTRKRN